MKITRYDSQQDMAAALAKGIADDLADSDNPVLALPGGNSPVPLMAALKNAVPHWDGIVVTTTDERCVPPDDKDSNEGQIRRVIGDVPSFLSLWRDGTIPQNLPSPYTVTVLGMGPDGHFASIFPDQAWDTVATLPYRITASKPPPERVTLPVNILLQSKRLILLVCGTEKTALVESILAGGNADLPVAKLMALAPHIELHMAP